ncbi:hypothetical protein FNV43_RR08783 [Rhamnella rubrinervis]|uniref:Leucine-rich repeat-containing N-terminal plant-type domain-containing protein n=1 Tax=Rhamnella rubrinervis TaxID=2594499 RepID=A0A8K0H997_9ROSA|nr:hypothetical protein FNV43_RR08783 [Rhamnella rubrinervis]
MTSIYSTFLVVDMYAVSGECLRNQQSLLLQFKHSLLFNATESTTLVKWNQSSDCCTWEGLTCEEGRVTGLNLSNESISGGILDNSTLFDLKYLKSLDLSLNLDLSSAIPSRIGNLTNLTNLNFSNAFSELYLDGVNISTPGNEWGQALSSSLPNLRVSSLSNCYLSGPIDQSLAKLQSLSVIRLDYNLFVPVPVFFSNYSNMTSMYLRSSGLYGLFPNEIFQVPAIQNFDISNNELLGGSLPEFLSGSGLQSLVITSTNFSGTLPTSIGNLRQLSRLDVSYNFFSGPLPNSITELTKLVYLDLAFNNFAGPILLACGEDLPNLNYIHLNGNSFDGIIPSFLFTLPSLQTINLSHNKLSGQVLDFPNASSSMLYYIDLSSNKLHGPVPLSIFKLKELKYLSLSSNKFNGSLQLDVIQGLSNLVILDLSYNNFSVNASGDGSNIFSFPKLGVLQLASCNLRIFPHLIKNQLSLYYLDISRNHIYGEIPSWIWNVGNGSKLTLNLSHNHFVALQEPYSLKNVGSLDLSFNQLHGKIPILPPEAFYIDLNGNLLTERIPKSLANCRALEVLNLGNNQMLHTFPIFLKNLSTMRVLILRFNKFYGSITCSESIGAWPVIQIFNVASNNFSGGLPGQCLIKWHAMMFENDVQSQLSDTSFKYGDVIPPGFSYEDAVTVTNKGLEMELVKIPNGFTAIDFSSNNFRGEITEELGQLKFLHVLNLSNNGLGGQIPSSFGNLLQLESLDLSRNHLDGTIPASLANLNFLQVLNLSFNQLVGRIPKGSQIQTFSADSFQDSHWNSGSIEIKWDFISVEVGFVVGFGLVIGPLVFSNRWRRCYFDRVEDIAFSMLPQRLLKKWLSWKMGIRK